jgi:hypothetical protein
MQVTSELDARMEMRAFVERAKAPMREWYIGVTADPERRLEAHGLQDSDWWIARRLGDPDKARRVAEALLKLGCDGSVEPAVPEGEEGAEEEDEGPAAAVYAYWKRGHTTP